MRILTLMLRHLHSNPTTTATNPNFPHQHIPQYFKYDYYVSDLSQQTKLDELCDK